MKKTTAALLAVMCALLSGCSLDGGSGGKKPINVSYSDMFGQKSDPETAIVTEQANAQKQAAAAEEPANAEPAAAESAPAASLAEGSAPPSATPEPTSAPASSSNSSNSSNESKPASSTEKTAAGNAPRVGGTESNSSDSNNSKTESEPRFVLVTPTKLPEKTTSDAAKRDIASTPLGGVCYLAYKPDTPAETSKPNQTTSGESGTESDTSNSLPKKEKTKYDYGYRVVFRTSSETYLMGTTPYKTCAWDDIGKVCKEIEEKLETECEMVGAPSLEDLKMFTESGICFPEKHEFWTSTKTAEKGFKAYYRSKNGTFYSTKSTSLTSGVCVIIKVKTSQSNNELLSSSWENFNALKAQLEKEATAYKAAASSKQ